MTAQRVGAGLDYRQRPHAVASFRRAGGVGRRARTEAHVKTALGCDEAAYDLEETIKKFLRSGPKVERIRQYEKRRAARKA